MKARTYGFTIAAIVFLLEQVSKWYITGPLDLQQVRQIYVMPIFNLTWTENYGISLGLFQAKSDAGRWALVAMTSAIATGVAVWIGREKERGDQFALGLILGGALGNILDRIRFGYVVDFADLNFRAWPEQLCWSYSDGACRPFYIFNVADAAISIGVAILLLRAFIAWLRERKAPKESEEHA